MIALLSASVIWAFSFSLIKQYLSGLDSNLVALIRLSLSFAVFVPFLRLKAINRTIRAKLILTGAIQYGLMYTMYIYSYRFLTAYQVAIFTIFTPIYVTLINDFCSKRFHRFFFLTALLAVTGTAIITYSGGRFAGVMKGFVFMQISNMSFAFGQVHYKAIIKQNPGIKAMDVFGLLYLGAVLLTAIPVCANTDWNGVNITAKQTLVLLYLGIIPSGICFFLWNTGATRVNTGTLAVFNNMKIPLAVACSILLFGERPENAFLFAIGMAIIISAIVMNEYHATFTPEYQPVNKPDKYP